VYTRRPRYPGKNPRGFHDKYKELNPERYASEVQKVLASGKTPAGMHRPIMVDEVLHCLRPAAGNVAVDCTLGGGGHARVMLERVLPGGRVIGLDVDSIELARTESRLRTEGYGPRLFVARHSNFAGLPQALPPRGSGTRTSSSPILVCRRCSSTTPIAASRTRSQGRSTCG
jgi:16S rRNA (cytosine1402-N4)-methyltransferase